MLSATEDCLYLPDENLPSSGLKWSSNFCFFLAGKTFETKSDSLAIFCDSKLVDGTLWKSRLFKLHQFPQYCIRIFVLTMSTYLKGKIMKIISPDYAFVPSNLKLRYIWKFTNKSFQTEFVDAYYVIPEPSVKLLLIAIRSNSAMFNACTVTTALMKRPGNTVYRGSFEI